MHVRSGTEGTAHRCQPEAPSTPSVVFERFAACPVTVESLASPEEQDRWAQTFRGRFVSGLALVVMGTRKSHHPPSASWTPRELKARGPGALMSEGRGGWTSGSGREQVSLPPHFCSFGPTRAGTVPPTPGRAASPRSRPASLTRKPHEPLSGRPLAWSR